MGRDCFEKFSASLGLRHTCGTSEMTEFCDTLGLGMGGKCGPAEFDAYIT